jgi:hypothetical protein
MRPLIALGALLLAVLTGCGGDDGGSGSRDSRNVTTYCDGPNLVYLVYSNSVGIAVSPRDPKCGP